MALFLTDQNTTAFKEVAIIRHPRVGEYAFGFITSTVVLQVSLSYFLSYNYLFCSNVWIISLLVLDFIVLSRNSINFFPVFVTA